MRKLLIPLLVLVFGCVSEESDLSVLSLNIKNRQVEKNQQKWEKQEPIVVWLINKVRPELIGFQSIDKSQFISLIYHLPEYAYTGSLNTNSFEYNNLNPIFYKKDQYELVSKSHFWLSETPEIEFSMSWDSSEPVYVAWAKFIDKKTGHIFYFFNTCLQQDSKEARIESSRILIQNIKYIAGDAPVILTGTLFDNPNDESYKILTENNAIQDSRVLTGKDQFHKTFTYNGYKNDVKEIQDYIFVNGYLNAIDHTVFQLKKDDIYISDHYPVVADLVFTNNENHELKLNDSLNKQP